MGIDSMTGRHFREWLETSEGLSASEVKMATALLGSLMIQAGDGSGSRMVSAYPGGDATIDGEFNLLALARAALEAIPHIPR